MRQEAQLRFFAENIPGPIAVIDASFCYVFANKVFKEIRGLEDDDIVGRRQYGLEGHRRASQYG